jgi:hypothetical protein
MANYQDPVRPILILKKHLKPFESKGAGNGKLQCPLAV